MTKSAMARGTRRPAATVWAFSNVPASRAPDSKARTMGAQPAACTATMRGRLGPIQPERLHLVECLPHADQAGAAAGRVDDRRRAAPSRTPRPARSPSSSCPRRGTAP